MGEYPNRRIPLPESPDSAIIPGMAVWRALALILLLVPGAFAQAPSRVASTLSGLLAMKPGETQPHVQVLGFSSPGDWGPPKTFRYDATNALATNAIRRATALGSGRWVHDWDGDVAAFGVLPLDADLLSSQVPGDSTSAMQAAADYADANNVPVVEIKLPGAYSWSTLRLKGVTLRGRLGTSGTAGNATQDGNVYAFQRPSPTNAFILDTTTANQRKPGVESMYLIGAGGPGTPNKKTISLVTDRNTFAVGTNDAPTLSSTNRWAYPIQWAMFYSNEGYYLGASPVTNAYTSGTNYVIQLMPNETFYATIGSTNLLRAGQDKVVFAPITASGWTDPCLAGYPAIQYGAGFSPQVKDVRIESFHTGIYVDSDDGVYTPFPKFDGQIVINADFAGLGTRNWLGSLDGVHENIVITGFSRLPFGNRIPAWSGSETNTIYAKPLRHTTFGTYNFLTYSDMKHVLNDAGVVGHYLDLVPAGWVDTMWIDNNVQYGILARRGQASEGAGKGLAIDKVLARGPLSTSAYSSSSLTQLTNSRAFMRITGEVVPGATLLPVSIHINYLDVAASAGLPKYDHLFDITGPTSHQISIGRIANAEIYSTIHRTNSQRVIVNDTMATPAAYLDTGWYSTFGSTNLFNLKVAGASALAWNGSGLNVYSRILGGTLWSDGSWTTPTWTPANSGGAISGAAKGWIAQSGLAVGRDSNTELSVYSAGSPILRFYNYGSGNGGSMSSPSNIVLSQEIGNVDAAGWVSESSASDVAARVQFRSLTPYDQFGGSNRQSWSATNQGSYLVFQLTDSLSTTRSNYVQFIPPHGGTTNRSAIVVTFPGATNEYVLGVTNSGGVLTPIYIPR